MGKVLRIREIGDPILSKRSEEVDIQNITGEMQEIIEDMKETLDFSNGFGIAAPQIGIAKRIIILQVKIEKCIYQNCEEIPTTIMINPTWKKISEETQYEYEGCLSVPSIRGKVERYTNIEVSYYTERGEKITKIAKGFTARDIQHECDHLDGIVFLEKVKKTQDYATKEMIDKFNLRK